MIHVVGTGAEHCHPVSVSLLLILAASFALSFLLFGFCARLAQQDATAPYNGKWSINILECLTLWDEGVSDWAVKLHVWKIINGPTQFFSFCFLSEEHKRINDHGTTALSGTKGSKWYLLQSQACAVSLPTTIGSERWSIVVFHMLDFGGSNIFDPLGPEWAVVPLSTVFLCSSKGEHKRLLVIRRVFFVFYNPIFQVRSCACPWPASCRASWKQSLYNNAWLHITLTFSLFSSCPQQQKLSSTSRCNSCFPLNSFLLMKLKCWLFPL